MIHVSFYCVSRAYPKNIHLLILSWNCLGSLWSSFSHIRKRWWIFYEFKRVWQLFLLPSWIWFCIRKSRKRLRLMSTSLRLFYSFKKILWKVKLSGNKKLKLAKLKVFHFFFVEKYFSNSTDFIQVSAY